MKTKLKFLMPIFAMAFLFSVGLTAVEDAPVKATVEQTQSDQSYIALLPAVVKVETKEAYKVDAAEYISAVAAKSDLGISSSYSLAGTSLFAAFLFAGSFLGHVKNSISQFLTRKNAIALGIAVALIASLFITPIGFALATVLPVVPGDSAARLKKLKEDRAAEFQKIEAINTKVEAEKRSRTADEKSEWKKIQDKIVELNEEIRDLEAHEEQRATIAKDKGVNIMKNENRGDSMTKTSKRYSLFKAIKETRSGKLTGLELEMDQEATNENRDKGISVEERGNSLNLPSNLFAFGKEKRDLLISTESADVMQTQFSDEIIPVLRPDPVVVQMGATTLTGLSGDFQMRRVSAASTMAWQGEGTALTETTPTFDNVKLQPNSLGGFTEVSDKFFLQSGFGVEQWLRNELQTALEQKLDLSALHGSGSGSEPTGLAGISGTTAVSFGATVGGAPTWAKMLEFISGVRVANASKGKLGFLSTPQAWAKLLQTPRQSSGVEGQFIINELTPEKLIGYPFVASNQVSSTLAEGGSGNVLSACFYGNWSELMIGQFGAINILVNPYLKSRERLVSIEISSHFDIKFRHAASFAVALDMVTT